MAFEFSYWMYNLVKDPGQLKNILYGPVSEETKEVALRLHVKLKQKIDQAAALPSGFPWPASPSY